MKMTLALQSNFETTFKSAAGHTVLIRKLPHGEKVYASGSLMGNQIKKVVAACRTGEKTVEV